jgi:nitroimidazol reductase NimA-like FMN-containing flavoprotein (pyridoxamine 5'-phosphate oxidase superfamily)
MWVVMSAAEREEFLAGVRVGVLSAAAGQSGRTLAVPIWYSYRPGGLLTVLTGRRSRKAGSACAFMTTARPTAMSASKGRSSVRRNSIPANGSRWPAATSVPQAATVTSRTTPTPGVRTWPSGCTRSTG